MSFSPLLHPFRPSPPPSPPRHCCHPIDSDCTLNAMRRHSLTPMTFLTRPGDHDRPNGRTDGQLLLRLRLQQQCRGQHRRTIHLCPRGRRRRRRPLSSAPPPARARGLLPMPGMYCSRRRGRGCGCRRRVHCSEAGRHRVRLQPAQLSDCRFNFIR